MKIFENIIYEPKFIIDNKDLKIEYQDNSIINYESFLLINPNVYEVIFPKTDKLYYKRVKTELDHILYKFEIGIITSPRQIIVSNDECISCIQFSIFKGKVIMNVFQRSANIFTLKDDITFLKWYLNKNFIKQNKELNVFVSMPHLYLLK